MMMPEYRISKGVFVYARLLTLSSSSSSSVLWVNWYQRHEMNTHTHTPTYSAVSLWSTKFPYDFIHTHTTINFVINMYQCMGAFATLAMATLEVNTFAVALALTPPPSLTLLYIYVRRYSWCSITKTRDQNSESDSSLLCAPLSLSALVKIRKSKRGAKLSALLRGFCFTSLSRI